MEDEYALGVDETSKVYRQWAKPQKPKEVVEAPDPSEDPDWGRMPPCKDCGGTFGHQPLCPTAVEETARSWSDKDRLSLARRVLESGNFDPRDSFTQEAVSREMSGEELLWAEHFRLVSARLAELLGPQKPFDPALEGPETAITYLARPTQTDFQPAPQPRKIIRYKKKGVQKNTLFDDEKTQDRAV